MTPTPGQYIAIVDFPLQIAPDRTENRRIMRVCEPTTQLYELTEWALRMVGSNHYNLSIVISS